MSILLGEHLLFDVGRQVRCVRQDPDLDEPHRIVFGCVELRVEGTRAEGHPLDGSRWQWPKWTTDVVLVTEEPFDHIRDALNVLMRMKRPHGSGYEPVVVEDPHRPESVVVLIPVVVEREVPAGTKPLPSLVVDLVVATDLDHRLAPRSRTGPTAVPVGPLPLRSAVDPHAQQSDEPLDEVQCCLGDLAPSVVDR